MTRSLIAALVLLPSVALAQTTPGPTVPPGQPPGLQQQLDAITGDITRQVGLLTAVVASQAQQISADQRQIEALKRQIVAPSGPSTTKKAPPK